MFQELPHPIIDNITLFYLLSISINRNRFVYSELSTLLQTDTLPIKGGKKNLQQKHIIQDLL